MQRIPNAIQLTDLDADGLTDLYAYPMGLDAPWVRANFVSSLDGAATSGDLTAALGTPADKTVLGLLRDLTDVILVGAGTARARNYGRAAPGPAGPRAPRARRTTAARAPTGGGGGRCGTGRAAGTPRARRRRSPWSPRPPRWNRTAGCSPTPRSRR